MASKENKKVKNSVFVDLFYEDETAEANDIALYNALNEEALPEGTRIQKLRIDNVLYMNFKNDVSFGVGGKVLVFGEHQATINENMPLRSLMYIGRAYEQLVPVRDRYRKKRVKLPKPEFYTFYNGKEKWEKELTLKLSDSYMVKEEEAMLELSVKVININPEEEHEILKKCQVLKEYGQFIEIIGKYEQQQSEDAYKKAIEECIEKGILADYLKRKGSEVVNMLIAEYDYDLDIEVQREEAYESGLEDGKEIGKELGVAEGKECVNKLYARLLEDKRFEDLAKSVKDMEYQEQLMKEYGI